MRIRPVDHLQGAISDIRIHAVMNTESSVLFPSGEIVAFQNHITAILHVDGRQIPEKGRPSSGIYEYIVPYAQVRDTQSIYYLGIKGLDDIVLKRDIAVIEEIVRAAVTADHRVYLKDSLRGISADAQILEPVVPYNDVSASSGFMGSKPIPFLTPSQTKPDSAGRRL